MINRERQGFTLIEILTALMIFTVAIMAVIEATALQVRAEQIAEDTTRAVILTQNLIEEIKYTGNYEEEENTGKFDGFENRGFEWWYKIESTELDDLYRLHATVSWSDGKSKRQHRVVTLITDPVDSVVKFELDFQQSEATPR